MSRFFQIKYYDRLQRKGQCELTANVERNISTVNYVMGEHAIFALCHFLAENSDFVTLNIQANETRATETARSNGQITEKVQKQNIPDDITVTWACKFKTVELFQNKMYVACMFKDLLFI